MKTTLAPCWFCGTPAPDACRHRDGDEPNHCGGWFCVDICATCRYFERGGADQ